MGAARIGVQLVVPPPQRDAVDALRRALGDERLGRTPAHCTLVPPLTLREVQLGSALERVWHVARAHAPLHVGLAAPAFERERRMLHLPLEHGRAAVEALHEAVCRPPLRGNPWPFLPHVTLVEDVDEAAAARAVASLAGFALAVRFDELVVRATSGSGADPDDWRTAARFALGPWSS